MKKPRRSKLRQLRFVHFKTWTGPRAVPACDPSGRGRVSFQGQLSPNKSSITCGECVEALKAAHMWPEED